jgi:ABC-type lipoprotein release transport system permease subunit
VIGIGSLLLGIPLAVLCAVKFREFFSRKPEVAESGSLDYIPEEVSVHF